MKKRLFPIVLGFIMLLPLWGCTFAGTEDELEEDVPASSSEVQTESQVKRYVVRNVKPMENENKNTGEPQKEPTSVPAEEVALGEASIIKAMGVGINLGNTFESFWEDKNNRTTGAQTIGKNTPMDYETCWGAAATTREIIDGMKAAGFQTLRIPVYWGNMMKNDGAFVIHEEYFDRVAEIIDYCHENQMWVVINIHHYDEFLVKNYSKTEVLEITRKLWSQIAARYQNYSDFLIFEGFNENLGTTREQDHYSEDEIYDYVNEMNQVFVEAVRETGGNNLDRMLIVSGYWTNVDKTTDVRFKMPKDVTPDKLMVSVHYIDNAYYWMNQIGSEDWFSYAKSQCELLKHKFLDNNIPVFVGECNSVYAASHFSPSAVYKDGSMCLEMMLNLMTDYGFIPVLWDDTDHFYSRENCEVKEEDLAMVIKRIGSKINQR